MEPEAQLNPKDSKLLNYWEDFNNLNGVKENIYEQVRKKKLENQRIFGTFHELEKDFKDAENLISSLNYDKDRVAIQDFNLKLADLRALNEEFCTRLENEKDNENKR